MFQRRRPIAPRLPMAAWVVCVLAACASAAGGAAAQEPEIVVNRWFKNDGPRFESLDGFLRGRASRGWLASDAYFVDLVLRLEFRAVEPGSEGAVLVRAWDGDRGRSGYRIDLADPATRGSRLGTVTSRRGKKVVTGIGPPRPASAASPLLPGEWHRLEVRCDHDRVAVALDGTTINEVDGSEPLAGYVGLEVARGVLEIRRVTVVQLPGGVFPCSGTQSESAWPAKAPGLTLPTLLHEEKPVYSVDAMRRKIEGTVVLNAVVGTDGQVQTVCVARALHPALDAHAVGAARRWRFTPGLKEGGPVPVLVTIELSFTLR